MGDHELLDIEEWGLVLNKMLKFHYNVSEEIKAVVQAIRQEMKPELIPLAEDKAAFGKIIKTAIRDMWCLEYEVDELQSKFADSIGKMDLENLDVDFIEDMMLKSKPLQSVLNDIRNRQKAKLEDIKKTYGDAIKDLEPMKVSRPPKPVQSAAPAPAPETPAEPASAAAPAPAPVAATA
ncbi:uncharacterized protein LOC111716616 [Eurytemora carolleeae]|uniref:uncharacterized protein LOC111716616 n=1 Tax=Eurytemora carolleeae TaxID=1294199 RepID=UPI000C775716|nr:uncharacterized protein LOC111716616 [Eurytemora carolleeae]XP_023347855.1 uncharacterized protein LOC111716616 [Eurytemora carolleeae]|eukprot:XP_023347854.1 uncharacterized protein LOC111716616 [Eurytemora affinis]